MKLYDYLFKKKWTPAGVTFLGITISSTCIAGALYCADRNVHARLINPLLFGGLGIFIMSEIAQTYFCNTQKADEEESIEEEPVEESKEKLNISEDFIAKYVKFLAYEYTNFWMKVYNTNRDEEKLLRSHNFEQEFSYAFGCGLLKLLAKLDGKPERESSQMLFSTASLIFCNLDRLLIESLNEEMDRYNEDLCKEYSEMDEYRNLLYCRVLSALANIIPKYQNELLNYKKFNETAQDISVQCQDCAKEVEYLNKFKVSMQDTLTSISESVRNFYNSFMSKCDDLTSCSRQLLDRSRGIVAENAESSYDCLSDINTFSADLYQGVQGLRSEMEENFNKAVTAQFNCVNGFRKYIDIQEYTRCIVKKANSNMRANDMCFTVCKGGEKLDDKLTTAYCIDWSYRQQKMLELETASIIKRMIKTCKAAPPKSPNSSALIITNSDKIDLSALDLIEILRYVSKNFLETSESSSKPGKKDEMLDSECIPNELTFAFMYGLVKVIDFRLKSSLKKVCNLKGRKHLCVKRGSDVSKRLEVVDEAMYLDLTSMLEQYDEESSKAKDIASPLLLWELLYRMSNHREQYVYTVEKIDPIDLLEDCTTFAVAAVEDLQKSSEEPENNSDRFPEHKVPLSCGNIRQPELVDRIVHPLPKNAGQNQTEVVPPETQVPRLVAESLDSQLNDDSVVRKYQEVMKRVLNPSPMDPPLSPMESIMETAKMYETLREVQRHLSMGKDLVQACAAVQADNESGDFSTLSTIRDFEEVDESVESLDQTANSTVTSESEIANEEDIQSGVDTESIQSGTSQGFEVQSTS